MEQLPAGWRLACKKAFKVNLPGHKQHKLYADIISVVLGMKPAFLVDCAHVTGEDFQLLLTSVCPIFHESQATISDDTHQGSVKCHYSCIFKDCCIITLNEDVMLVSLSGQKSIASTHTDSEETGHWPYYVNIEQGQTCAYIIPQSSSKYVSLESIYTKLCDEVESVVKRNTCFASTMGKEALELLPSGRQQQQPNYKENTSSYYTSLVACRCGDVSSLREIVMLKQQYQSINLCTLFGRLLGYPIVYWFEPQIGYSLDMVELVCYTVTVRKRHDPCKHRHFTDIFQKDKILYSFSLPKHLFAAVEEIVTGWFQRVESIAFNRGLYAHFGTETVCLPSVSL